MKPGYPYSVADLLNRAKTNRTLKAVVAAWSRGRYPSFEAALVGAVVELADENARLTGRVMDLLRDNPVSGIGPETTG
jgi:hypothetical protein